MSGDLITSFNTEVQTRIMSNQKKYNPDGNEFIDADEIGALLKDFNAASDKELLQKKSLAAKISNYVFPKADVKPAYNGGYTVEYSNGNEKFLSKEEAEKMRNKIYMTGEPEACKGISYVGAAINSIVFTGMTVLSKTKAGRLATAATGLGITLGMVFMGHKFANNAENNRNIQHKLFKFDAANAYS